MIGQALIIVALVATVILGFAALAVDTGVNFVDRRTVQSAADTASLAGAPVISQSADQAMVTAQQYAWAALRQPAPAGVSACATTSSASCVVTNGAWPGSGGYQVTVTTPYSAVKDPIYQNLAQSILAVDITHRNPAAGFEGVLGFGSVTVSAHAAALTNVSSTKFPFALATRFLNLTGNGDVAALGGVMVGSCDDGGKGDYASNSYHGGINTGGGKAVLSVGQSIVGGTTPTEYAAAQVVLLENPADACSAPSGTNASTNFAPINHLADPLNAGATDFNYWYGFNSGPSGCTTSTSPQSTCAVDPVGSGSPPAWEDACWFDGAKLAAVQVNDGSFNNLTGAVTAPANYYPCGSAPDYAANGSHEGSFNGWRGFPNYPSPSLYLAAQTDAPARTVLGSLSAGGGGTTKVNCSTTSGCGTPQVAVAVYNDLRAVSSHANLLFAPGWYIFQGSNASVNLQNNSQFACAAPASNTFDKGTVPGCVFIFQNGAQFSVSNSDIECSADVSTFGNCAFEFSATSTTTPAGAMTIASTTVHAHPIVLPANPFLPTGKMPLVWSSADIFDTNSNNCGSVGCAVSMTQAGSVFDVFGTIYAPHGIANFAANAAPVSGQLVADTVQLQAGSSANPAGVTYNGGVVAPITVPAQLIE